MRLSAVFLILTIGAAHVARSQEKPAPSPDDTGVTLSGYLQTDLRHADPGAMEKAPSHEINLRRARVGVSGKVTQSVSYNVVVQGDGGNANSASILDALADITLNAKTKVRAGQYKYDFDIEGRESDSGIPMMDRPFITNSVAGGLSGGSTASSPAGSFRDRGVSIIGELGHPLKWGYSVGVFQGAGRGSDNNSAYSTTVNLRAQPLDGLRLNLGYLTSTTSDEGTAEARYRAWTTGAAYDGKQFFVRGEYYRGNRGTSAATQNVDGFYLIGSFTVSPRLDVLGRFQTVDDGQFSGGATASSADLGLQWYFVRRDKRSGTFVAINYMNRNADASFTRGLTLLNDGRGVSLSDGRAAGSVIAARLQVRF